MKRNPVIFINHILESISLIEEYTLDITLEYFISTIKVQDQVIRRLEIIGEAMKNLPKEMKS
jgi:uncharacterized protein with HEPN domain